MIVTMKIDSCRKCGEQLQVMNTCNQPLHFECNNCNSFVDDPIHHHEFHTSQSFLQNFGVNGN